jgi:hypothetical protein
MSEHHHIVGLARGEPLPLGRVGIRVRFGLSGSPSPRWSQNLRARLTRELAGHAAVGHLQLNDIVQGQEIVLEGVESEEAPNLAGAVERAVDAANGATDDDRADDEDPTRKIRQQEADDIAGEVRAAQSDPGPASQS